MNDRDRGAATKPLPHRGAKRRRRRTREWGSSTTITREQYYAAQHRTPPEHTSGLTTREWAALSLEIAYEIMAGTASDATPAEATHARQMALAAEGRSRPRRDAAPR